MIDLAAQIFDLSFTVLGMLLLFAFLPPILFVIWFRNSERRNREPWGDVFRAFFWGAVIGVLVGVLLSLALMGLLELGGFILERFYVRLGEALGEGIDVQFLILVLLIAPIAEEFAKGLGVFRVRYQINEIEDGLVYGASSGLGFGATENLLYGGVAYVAGGLGASLVVIGVRSFSSALLHASATSTFGYGVARRQLIPGAALLPFYLLAVFMHGAYNFFASFGELFAATYGDAAALFGLGAAIAVALLALGLARSTLTRRDREIAA